MPTCVEEPRATAIDRSILFLTATNTACGSGGPGRWEGYVFVWELRRASRRGSRQKAAVLPAPAAPAARRTRRCCLRHPARQAALAAPPQPRHPPTVTCSATLPAMGSTMRPRNAWLMPLTALTSTIAPVKKSAGGGQEAGGGQVGRRQEAGSR